MHRSIPVIITTAAAVFPLTAAAAATHPTPQSTHAHPTTATPGWLTYNATTHTALINVVAGYNTTNGGKNYNGAAKGAFSITVPLNTKVVLTLTNNGAMPHSVEIIKAATTLPATPAPAYKGWATPNFGRGMKKGAPADILRFTANKAGTYRLACGVPGHALSGMWDTFIVSASAKTATYATPSTHTAPIVTTHTYAGPGVDMQWGTVQVTIVVKGKRIIDIQATAPTERQRSAFINQQAVPMLRQEVLQAQSATIDVIGGATMTSDAYYQSLVSALQAAHKAHTL